MKDQSMAAEDIGEIEDPAHRALFEKAEPFLRTRHNVVHTMMAYHYALHLLSAEGGEPSVVIPAVLLHDVGWSAIPEEQQLLAFGVEVREPALRRKHEIEGAGLAAKILNAMSYPQDLISAVTRIIDGHDTREGAFDLNDMIVRDADKLWRYSRTGFLIDSDRFQCERERYAQWLSERIARWFFTKAAARLARDGVKKRREEAAASRV